MDDRNSTSLKPIPYNLSPILRQQQNKKGVRQRQQQQKTAPPPKNK
jgi:hypothetical protein